MQKIISWSSCREARFLIGNGDIGGAIPILEALQKRRSRHPQVLEMLSRCYRELGDWEHLRKMLPALKKGRFDTG